MWKKEKKLPIYERLIEGDEVIIVDRTPKGYVPVLLVGGKATEPERFLVQTRFFNHPCLMELLDIAAQEFGYEQQGIIRIPCGADRFRQVISVVSKSRCKI